MKIYTALAFVYLVAACHNKKNSPSIKKDTIKVKPVKQLENNAHLYTDTLQFIHFEGNFDYWYGVFIDARKDTLQLVVNDPIPAKFKNKLVEVKWFADTLFEAGDNDSKYAAKRLNAIRQIDGALFSAPITEEKIVYDIKDLPEVKENADQTAIAERPTDEKAYYLVETGTHGEDNFSRLFVFRVYVYPKYEIRFFDPAGDTEMSWTNGAIKNNKHIHHDRNRQIDLKANGVDGTVNRCIMHLVWRAKNWWRGRRRLRSVWTGVQRPANTFYCWLECLGDRIDSDRKNSCG